MRAWVVAAGAVLAGVGGGGCGDECSRGDDHCEGQEKWYCSDGYHSGTFSWEHDDACRGDFPECIEVEDSEGLTHILCAASTEPDAACDGAADGTVCVGETVVRCQYHYLVEQGECDEPGSCISSESADGSPLAFCSLAGARACCERGHFCSGLDLVTCDSGYPVHVEESSPSCPGPEEPCPEGGCVEQCAECDRLSDPRCAGALCDVEAGICESTCPCAAGYACQENDLVCLIDETAPPCADGCGLYRCVEELDRCATHCVEDSDCVEPASCADGVCA
jgi:hypothetical protein